MYYFIQILNVVKLPATTSSLFANAHTKTMARAEWQFTLHWHNTANASSNGACYSPMSSFWPTLLQLLKLENLKVPIPSSHRHVALLELLYPISDSRIDSCFYPALSFKPLQSQYFASQSRSSPCFSSSNIMYRSILHVLCWSKENTDNSDPTEDKNDKLKTLEFILNWSKETLPVCKGSPGSVLPGENGAVLVVYCSNEFNCIYSEDTGLTSPLCGSNKSPVCLLFYLN